MKTLQKTVWMLFASLMLFACGQKAEKPPVPQPTATIAVPAPEQVVIVKDGDWLIKRFGNNWQAVCNRNQLKNCNLIHPGQKLTLPTGVTEAAVIQPAPPAMTISAYTVKTGDSLWRIVGLNWPKVCQSNTIRNCHLIHPGQVLQIPTSLLTPVKKERRHE